MLGQVEILQQILMLQPYYAEHTYNPAKKVLENLDECCCHLKDLNNMF